MFYVRLHKYVATVCSYMCTYTRHVFMQNGQLYELSYDDIIMLRSYIATYI